MSDIVGMSDPDEVLRQRKKFVATMRAVRRHENRMADIDWEFDVLRPKTREFEKKVVTLGELPTFALETNDDDQDAKQKAPRSRFRH